MANITLKDCRLQVRTKAGTLASGKDKVKSISLKGVSHEAEAQKLLDVSNAFGAVIKNPVLEVVRVDENLVSAE
jgi:hypothetical protein